MLTLLTNINHIKTFKKNKIWNPSSVQRLAIADPLSPGGYRSGLTLVLHGKLVCSDGKLFSAVHHVCSPLLSPA